MFGFLKHPWDTIKHNVSSGVHSVESAISNVSSSVKNEISRDFQKVSQSQVAQNVRRVENKIFTEVQKDVPIVFEQGKKVFNAIEHEISDERQMVKDIAVNLYSDVKSSIGTLERDAVGIVKHGENIAGFSLPFIIVAAGVGLALFVKFV
jgi:hypothetical protein